MRPVFGPRQAKDAPVSRKSLHIPLSDVGSGVSRVALDVDRTIGIEAAFCDIHDFFCYLEQIAEGFVICVHLIFPLSCGII